MNNKDLDTIIEHLNRLTLQQQQLTQQIADLQTEIQGRQQDIIEPNNNDNLAQELQVRTRPENNSQRRPIRVGDRVRVKNPGRDQPNTGTIHSYMPSRLFVRIKWDNCDITINRAPGNVTRIEL
jgi:hypothetical protein